MLSILMVDNNIKLFNEIKILFDKNKSDSAIISIFRNIDEWSIIKDDFFNIFINVKFNEDIYVALLASTIQFRENKSRIKYLEYVNRELSKVVSEIELKNILSGL